MAPGQFVRSMLGRHFRPLGEAYRRLFVDLDAIACELSNAMPTNASVLDIGGGDGALIEKLLRLRPDLHVTMTDLAPAIGSFLSDPARVTILPATDFSAVVGKFDCVTIADVVHHVPPPNREGFFAALADSCRSWGCQRLILKDVEPCGMRAAIAFWCDRYITGDRQMVPFSRSDFGAMASRYFPVSTQRSSMPDFPNYCQVLSW